VELGAKTFEEHVVMSDKSTTTIKGGQLIFHAKDFSLRIIRLVESLPNSRTANVIGKQLLRSATSVGANYRAARRGRSNAEFCAKLGIVEEEADESVYWRELLAESGIVQPKLLSNLLNEANEIVAMIVASIRTARSKNSRKSQ
jgi:four helix bundle protein